LPLAPPPLELPPPKPELDPLEEEEEEEDEGDQDGDEEDDDREDDQEPESSELRVGSSSQGVDRTTESVCLQWAHSRSIRTWPPEL
jgi:hypothetical protein